MERQAREQAMKVIDFYGLSRTSQDRLLGSLGASFEPKPLLWRRARRPTAARWLALAAAAALVLVALVSLGFGELGSVLAIHSTPLVVVYFALVGLVAYGVLRALAHQVLIRGLPFRPGLYLFPANLIDARSPRLRVFALADLRGVSASGAADVALRFGGETFTFPVEPTQRDQAIELVERARTRMQGTIGDAERRMLDPLEPPLVVSSLAPTVPLKSSQPRWGKYAVPIAAAVGLVLGGTIFYVRDTLSDARMFAAAKSRNDTASYKSYLERGEEHREVVSGVLLPRAELRLAVAEGSVDAIDAFMKAYPEVGIQPEVDAARRTALAAAFAEAQKAGTLAALAAFDERYDAHGHDKQLEQARHAIYQRALARYRSRMPEDSARMGKFVERLVAWAERTGARKLDGRVRGPIVQVRLRRLPSRDLDRADDLVRQNPMYRGEPSLPTRYLDDAHLAPHEKRAAEALARGLGSGFDPEVLAFAAGPPLAEDVKKAKGPTLAVSYRVEPSGAAYASKQPRGIYVGLVFYFDLDVVLPGDNEPFHSEQSFTRRIPVEILKKVDEPQPAGKLEAAVYDTMLKEAFAELEERYLAEWYRPN